MAGTERLDHVSDTARLVAYYRALETERPDALFRDSLARRLAGDRGEALARKLREQKTNAWAIVARTSVFDEIILHAVIREGVDAVVNLAAGLDTRPYRLPLPKTLRWVEVDFPAVVAAKDEALHDQTSRCRLERIPLDLSDDDNRRALLARLGRETKKSLVVTEGLLMYLDEASVAKLAEDIHAQPSFRLWLLDCFNRQMIRFVNRRWEKIFGPGGTRMRFGTDDVPGFFARAGWRPRSLRYALEEGRRLHREMTLAPLLKIIAAFATSAQRQKWLRSYTFALFEHGS